MTSEHTNTGPTGENVFANRSQNAQNAEEARVQSQADDSSRQHNNAAHVPPSVLAQHVGGPHVLHEYPQDSKAKRHSSISHQEKHIMG